MVENIQGSNYIPSKQISQSTQPKDIQTLLNSKRLQQNNPYGNTPVFDKTDISSDAINLLKKEEEVDQFKNAAKDQPEVNSDKVAQLKAQYDSKDYKMPSNEKLADALLGNADFRSMMGF